MRFNKLPSLFCVLVLAVGTFSGCKPTLLPNSSISDTAFNRQIADFMQTYVNAMEKRSLGDLLALVSQDYHDKSQEDDSYNYNSLKERLEKYFALTSELTLKTHLQNVEQSSGKILVTYHFMQKVVLAMPSGPQRTTMSDVNRLFLIKTPAGSKNRFEIVAGL